MATVKVKFRPSSIDGRPGTIVYFVTHRRIVRQITTGYKVFPCEWDEKTSKLIVPDKGRTNTIKDIARRIHRDINRLEKIVESLKNNGNEFSTDTIVGLFHEADKGESFFSFMEEVTATIKKCLDIGAEIAVVVGGGNIWRGRQGGGMDRVRADKMGMLATVMNALCLRDFFRAAGIEHIIFIQHIQEIPDIASEHFFRDIVILLKSRLGQLVFREFPLLHDLPHEGG